MAKSDEAMGRWMLALLLTGCAGTATAQDDDEIDQSGWHGGAWLASSYDFRGVAQSQENPVGQGELSFQAKSGFYAAVWGSAVDYTAAGEADDGVDLEIDASLGWAGPIAARWSADLSLTRLMYPSSVEGVDYDYNELEAELWLDETWYAHVGYSNDVFNFGETGIYTSAGVEWGIAGTPYTVLASAGWYALDDAAGDSYGDFRAGVAGAHGALVWKVEYVDTVSYGERLIDALGEPSEREIVATIGLEF